MSSGKDSFTGHKVSSNNCWDCEYFAITHDRLFPYKCSSMNFKSKALPCFEVVKIEGNKCLSFKSKEIKH